MRGGGGWVWVRGWVEEVGGTGSGVCKESGGGLGKAVEVGWMNRKGESKGSEYIGAFVVESLHDSLSRHWSAIWSDGVGYT